MRLVRSRFMTAAVDGFTVYRRTIPEQRDPLHPLGRHVQHDSRSRQYRVPHPVGAPRSVLWDRRTPVLDQGNLGSCTGNATVGVLGTEPFYSSLQTAIERGLTLDETEAVAIYTDATLIDPYQGEYPPTDTGSDGLSVAKVAQTRGLIAGYEHAFSIDDVIAALQTRPGITGTNWRADMDSPSSEGIVKYTGVVRGGHEYEIAGVDLERGLMWFWNSWGSWGLNGRFAMSLEDYVAALKEDGDATFFVPNTDPPPIPTPPGPTPPDDPKVAADLKFIEAADPWAQTPHWWRKATVAAQAYRSWKATR